MGFEEVNSLTYCTYFEKTSEFVVCVQDVRMYFSATWWKIVIDYSKTT